MGGSDLLEANMTYTLHNKNSADSANQADKIMKTKGFTTSCTACASLLLLTGEAAASSPTSSKIPPSGNRATSGFVVPLRTSSASTRTNSKSQHSLPATRRRAHQKHERKIIIGGGDARGEGGYFDSRTALFAIMIDTNTKAKSVSSNSNSNNDDDQKPPVPRDDFQHQSLAGIPTDYGPYLKVGSYQINAFGLLYMAVAIFWAIPWAICLSVCKALIEYTDKIEPRRRHVDFLSSTWGWLSALVTNSLPETSGLENIPKGPAVSQFIKLKCN